VATEHVAPELVVDYQSSLAKTRGVYVPMFFVGSALAGVLIVAAGDLLLSQYNSYLGMGLSFFLDGGVVIGAAFLSSLASCFTIAVGHRLRRRMGSFSVSPLILGILFGISVFAPPVIDVYVVGRWNVSTGEPEANGIGMLVSWIAAICFVVIIVPLGAKESRAGSHSAAISDT
jgi:hypothetical protein